MKMLYEEGPYPSVLREALKSDTFIDAVSEQDETVLELSIFRSPAIDASVLCAHPRTANSTKKSYEPMDPRQYILASHRAVVISNASVTNVAATVDFVVPKADKVERKHLIFTTPANFAKLLTEMLFD